jgi:uncharacterized membrane protein
MIAKSNTVTVPQPYLYNYVTLTITGCHFWGPTSYLLRSTSFLFICMRARARTHTEQISFRKYLLVIWKTVLKCLPYAWTQTMHSIYGPVVKIKYAYSQPIIQLVHVLSAFSAYRIWRLCQLTSIKYLRECSFIQFWCITHGAGGTCTCMWQYWPNSVYISTQCLC